MTRRLSLMEFIARAIKKHCARYTYENVQFINTATKVSITCQKHGVFIQTPADHLYGGYGCPKCKFETQAITRIKTAAEQFVRKARKIHGGKYDYSKVEYNKAKLPVIIVCKKHGEFTLTPSKHLGGGGCKKCGYERLSQQKRKTLQQFIKQAVAVHKSKFQYNKVDYVNGRTKVEIICPIHGSFFQTPNAHLRGQGCLKCSSTTSKAEQQIMDILIAKGIVFEREKTFDNLRGTTPHSRLRYDFWLPEYKLLIEYDGEHHFVPVRMRGRGTLKQATFLHKRCVENDKRKNVYARKNGYSLLRIRYDEDVELCVINALVNFQRKYETRPLKK